MNNAVLRDTLKANYDIARKPSVEDIRVSFQLAAAAMTPQVRAFSPDDNEVQPVAYIIQNGRLKCELPSLSIYSIIEIR